MPAGDSRPQAEGGHAVRLAALGVSMFVNTLNLSVLFPYLKFLVKDFGVAEADAGYWVGLIAAAFMAGRSVTSAFWGWFADRYGRKPVMLISLVSLAVLSPVFGLATGVWMAASVRFLIGMLNSLIGVGKVMASEIAPDCPHQQTQAMSVVSVAWGAAMVIGPGIGGLLSSGEGPFGTPYLYPMYFVTLLALVAAGSAWRFLPETLPADKAALDAHRVSWCELLTCRKVLWATALYCAFSFQALANTELLNLWAATDRTLGGLGFSQAELGVTQTVAGAVMLALQSFTMPALARRYGQRRLALTTTVLYVPFQLAYPVLGALPAGAGALFGFGLLLSITSTLSSFTFTLQFLFVNNSAHPANRAAVQGLAMTLASVAKALGPGVIGAIFAWSVGTPRPLLLSHPLSFIVLAGALLVVVALTYWLPPGLAAEPPEAKVSETVPAASESMVSLLASDRSDG
eukprot:TRINITY_DN7731_c0_g1_i1.p1 TRINITY_DN7731_c0_g1~~TRINITY_DN7731_c0_g1_i1.p1  ORF type:complete len:493 (+),score=114.37 TRINITY_DN7731_c0_g1_i1:103-1479(+)